MLEVKFGDDHLQITIDMFSEFFDFKMKSVSLCNFQIIIDESLGSYTNPSVYLEICNIERTNKNFPSNF